MAGKSTQLTLRVAAVNATSRVFRSIASSAVGVTKSIAKWGSVAVGAGLTAFAASAKKLGQLSDVAQSAGTATDEITKLSGALDMLGVKGAKPEELATAFQRMTKSTGQVGLEGFHNVVAEISKLPTVQERANAAMRTFGRTGLNFLPVIEAAAEGGVGALKDLEAAMPGISQAAADAGDAAADAMGFMAGKVKQLWFDGIGKIAQMIDSDFKGGIREAAMVAGAQMEYFAKVAWRYGSTFFKNFRQVASETFQWLGKVISNALTMIGGMLVTAFEDLTSRVSGILDDIGAGAAALMARISGDTEREQEILRTARRDRATDARDRQKQWNEYYKLMGQLDWKYEGLMGNIDTGDLAAARDAAVETAKRAGEAYAKAAKRVGANIAVDEARDAAGNRRDTTNPEAVMGGSYKALTFALRQGYATGMAEVKNLLKKAVDGINGVKAATEDVAENLDFAEV